MRRTATAIGITIAAVVIAAVFLARFAPAQLVILEIVKPAIAALIVLLATYGTGALLRFERTSDRIAIGFAIFGTVTALVSWISVAVVVPLTTIAAGYGAWRAAREMRGTETRVPLLLIPPITFAFIAAILPVNSPDELAYKLAVPHAYQLYGRMTELPLTSHSYLVLALQFTALAALQLGGGIAAKLAHFALYLCALAIVQRAGGRWPAIVLAWTPALMLIAGWAWSEWGVLALLILSYERYSDADFTGAAIALGSACASKYTALPWLLAYFVLLAIRRRDALAKTAFVTAITGGFFYLRNAIWTGSPIAPLLLPDAPQVANYRGGSALAAFFAGADIFDARLIDESLGVLLPIAFIAGLFAVARKSPLRDLAILGAIQMPILLVISPGSRNIVNGVAPLAIAGVAIIETAAPAVIAAIVIAVALIAQSTLVLFSFEAFEPLPYLAGKENAEQYIARLRDFAKPYDWLAHTPPNSRVLLLGENRTFYLQRQFIAAGNLDGPRIAHWLASFPTSAAFRDELHRRGVTHVLVHYAWYRAGNEPMSMIEKEYVLEVTPQTHAMLSRLFGDFATKQYEDANYVIYELR